MSVAVGDWRWIRPPADAEDYLERDWHPGLIVGLQPEGASIGLDAAGTWTRTLLAEHTDGRRGRVDADRVGELCRAEEFLDSTWSAMTRRADEVRGSTTHRSEGTCSK